MPRMNPLPVRPGAAIRCRPRPLPREGAEGQSPRRVGWEKPVRLTAQGRKARPVPAGVKGPVERKDSQGDFNVA